MAPYVSLYSLHKLFNIIKFKLNVYFPVFLLNLYLIYKHNFHIRDFV